MFTPDEKRILLRLAREAITAAARGVTPPEADESELTPALRQPLATFVTLTCGGELRGCIGGLEARNPLYEDVRYHAAQSAMRDPRFQPVRPEEVPDVDIEISILTPARPLDYQSPSDLLHLLKPTQGVTLAFASRRATFLPQVWERVPSPEQFLTMLCEKMGLPGDLWRQQKLEVQVYEVEKIVEEKTGD